MATSGAFTNFTEDLVLDWLLTNATATRPTAWYVGLFTAAPSDTGGGTEVSGFDYARQSVTFTVSGTSPTNATNGSAIEFPAANGGTWGTITYVGVFDASTSGNLLAYAALDSSRTINDGDIFRIPAGDLDISLD